jgi:hypothetical protein
LREESGTKPSDGVGIDLTAGKSKINTMEMPIRSHRQSQPATTIDTKETPIRPCQSATKNDPLKTLIRSSHRSPFVTLNDGAGFSAVATKIDPIETPIRSLRQSRLRQSQPTTLLQAGALSALSGRETLTIAPELQGKAWWDKD